MAGATLRLLGGFGLSCAESPLDISLSTQRLVAFLALRGPAPRSVVSGTLWPEMRESQALANLRTGIWRLGRISRGVVWSDGTRLGIDAAVSVDSQELEACAARLLHGRHGEGWRGEGLGPLWRGQLLPGWYEDWIGFERERLNQVRLHALEYAAAALMRRGEFGMALQLALEAVRTEPLRETANAVLMSVYLAEGNVSDAVRHYQLFKDSLSRELGVEPSFSLGHVVARHGCAACGRAPDSTSLSVASEARLVDRTR